MHASLPLYELPYIQPFFCLETQLKASLSHVIPPTTYLELETPLQESIFHHKELFYQTHLHQVMIMKA